MTGGRCPLCGGTGRIWLFWKCRLCKGTGTAPAMQGLDVTSPTPRPRPD